ncbi:E3 ubiquitin-protein ligase ORTHRUS 2-like protein [Drosera capensis]
MPSSVAAAEAARQLPCDADGSCMVCLKTPSEAEKLFCKTCGTPWHAECLAKPPESLESTVEWECPDCSGDAVVESAVESVPLGAGGELVAAIRRIEADDSLTEEEKAKRRQQLLGGTAAGSEEAKGKEREDADDILKVLDENMKCSFCMQLPDRPVTTPCGHNFCLKCFEKWVRQGKKTCAKCRKQIPDAMARQPKINSTVVYAIRMARMRNAAPVGAPRVIQFVHNDDLPDKAFTTERAKKTGKANAASGRIFVTIPNDHLGPILAENDPVNNTGVLVGDNWEDRLACRQWGTHFPHVSGIAGQSTFGAQSVVLSGGYADDEDHGDGGRDLSGNKRTNKKQSFDQTFCSGNEALRLSCRKGYPVRVVRSGKDKRSHYAPEKGVRYDGIYRIEKCWRKPGEDGFLVCRYLFVRCDNSPAPWTRFSAIGLIPNMPLYSIVIFNMTGILLILSTLCKSDEHGDRPRVLPKVNELKKATDITERKEAPHWDFDEEGCWKWKRPPPPSRGSSNGRKLNATVNKRSKQSYRNKILKEFSCLLCRKVLNLPITTPCAHNFCKSCLDAAFAGQTLEIDRNRGGRQLRTKKNIMKCPSCAYDIADFLQTAQVNKELMAMLESVKRKLEDKEKSSEAGEGSSGAGSEEDAISEGEEGGESEPEEADNKPRASKRQKVDGENKEIEMVESDEVKSKPKVPSNKSKRIAGPRKGPEQKPTAGAAFGEDEAVIAAGEMKQGPKGP